MPKKIKLLSIEEDKVSVVDETGAEVPNEPETVPVVVEAPVTDIEEVPQPVPKEKPKRPSRASSTDSVRQACLASSAAASRACASSATPLCAARARETKAEMHDMPA